MGNTRGRKRSPISTLLAIFVVVGASVVLSVMRVNSFFRRKYVPIEQLKFPVLVIQPGGVALFAEWEDVSLQKFPQRSPRTPVNGAVIIDSEFNQFTQENVARQKEGELKWMARYLLPGMRVKYTFDLRRRSESGRQAMMEMIRRAPPLSDDPGEDAAMRLAAQQQTTMAGVLDALHFYKPVEPATEPGTEPATEPGTEPTGADSSTPATVEPEPAMREADKPGDPN